MPKILYIDANDPLDIRVHYEDHWRIMTEDMYAHYVAQICQHYSEPEKSEQVITNQANWTNIDTRLFFALTVILTLFYGVHGSLIGLAIFCLFKALTCINRKS